MQPMHAMNQYLQPGYEGFVVGGSAVGTGDRWQLFNLADDPRELEDLASEHPDKVVALKGQWDAYAEYVGYIESDGSSAVERARDRPVLRVPARGRLSLVRVDGPRQGAPERDPAAPGDFNVWGSPSVQARSSSTCPTGTTLVRMMVLVNLAKVLCRA